MGLVGRGEGGVGGWGGMVRGVAQGSLYYSSLMLNYLFKINVRTFIFASCFLFGEVNILVHFDAELFA